jgi:hypothetical protein
MSPADNPNIHRYLDDAFAGIPVTPEVQDLKEEIRGNLGARASELEASGKSPASAAAAAVKELGDIRSLVDSLGDSRRDAAAVNRVKPKPGFVIRAVVFSLFLVGGLALVIVGALHVVPVSIAIVASIVTALAVGAIVDDSLRQETSQHYPLPNVRSVLFGSTAISMTLGLAFSATYFADPSLLWLIVTGPVLTLAAIISFIWLGVTQTNRTKPWALELQRGYVENDPFTKDPAAAARFGIYTVVIWTLAFAAFIALSITVGFAWSWLAILLGFAGFMLTLARMLFAAGNKADKTEKAN